MPGNIVKIVIEGKAFWILIDLDASCNLDDLAGQKVTSTAFFPPEMARRELNKLQDKPESDIEIVPASKQFEMWYLGLLLLQLCTKDAPTLWQSTQADNILEVEDMQSLAHFWDTLKIQKVSKIKGKQWAPAADLALWLLQEKASRRPESMSVVFAHKFFTDGGSLRFLKSVDETMNDFEQRQARELATAIEGVPTAGSTARVKEVLDGGGAHVNLALEGSLVLPIHRAARLGLVEVIDLLLAEVHREAWPRVLDTQTEFNFTALHWCVVYGVDDHDGRYAAVADKLIMSGADTSLVNNRGKTAWDVGEAVQAGDVLKEFEDFATLDEAHAHANPALRKEKERRKRRPAVDETFRDDIELDLIRFTLWCTAAFSTWKRLAEGAFGQVFLALFVSPAIEVSGRQFHKAVIKVPKAGGVEELKGEVEELGKLEHVNIVLILGMCYGPSPGNSDSTYMSKHTSNQSLLVTSSSFMADCSSFMADCL